MSDTNAEILRGYTLKEAARAISISENTLRLHIKRGSAAAIHCGRRVIVPGAEVARILREGLPSLATEKVGSVQ
ncbi:MAG: helix-turn-helix domain-containing protein [Acidipila sp.]|nr:helix-turn-helix domain-containing protein [Acidipila sp.]